MIVGVSQDTFAPSATVLGVPGILPENLCIIIIQQFEEPQIRSIRDLNIWGNMLPTRVANTVGKSIEFPSIDSNIFNFVDKMKEMYPTQMIIDTENECACKIRQFHGGLVLVKVLDSDSRVVDEVVDGLPEGTAIAFIASTPTLFKF